MIIIKLKEAKLAYERRAERRITYEQLEDLTGIAAGTLAAMASRKGYNATLDKIDTICDALDVPLQELLERRPTRAKKMRRAKVKRAGKATDKKRR